MANDLSFTQISTILNDVVGQATGAKTIAPVNTNEFITVAQTALKMGYDPLLTSISQVLSRTIFSIRPYYRKFSSLQVSNQRYGNMTRKINISDKDWENDDRLPLTEGSSVDQFQVSKPKILQTNFYGANVFQKHITVFRDQLDTAFSDANEFGQFISMVMSNATDMIEQAHENLARTCVANFIGGKIAGDITNCIHLLSEYNAATGLTLTATSVYQPDNFKAFMQWVYARIATLSSLLTERSIKYHTNITDRAIPRHTPYDRQRMYMFAPSKFQTDATVLANTYNEKYLRMGSNEVVNFWQSIDKPDTIKVKPVYLDVDGSLKSPEAAITQENVFGVIFDEEAMGYTVVNQWSAPTPFNARGGYSNLFWHFTDKYWNDFTENGIVLLLD